MYSQKLEFLYCEIIGVNQMKARKVTGTSPDRTQLSPRCSSEPPVSRNNRSIRGVAHFSNIWTRFRWVRSKEDFELIIQLKRVDPKVTLIYSSRSCRTTSGSSS